VPCSGSSTRTWPPFPWSWSVVPWLVGVPGDRVAGADGPDTAAKLGRFLAALHTAAGSEAPRSAGVSRPGPLRFVAHLRAVDDLENGRVMTEDQAGDAGVPGPGPNPSSAQACGRR
jgi:hypothetical protein